MEVVNGIIIGLLAAGLICVTVSTCGEICSMMSTVQFGGV